MNNEDKLMMELKPKFQREIFQKLIDKYNGSIKASQFFKIPASSIRCYKNLYFKTVPKSLVKKLTKFKITNNQEIQLNTLRVLNKKDIINHSLDIGRVKRREYFIKLKEKIPSLNEILKNNELSVSKWFEEYRNLVNSNFRKININYVKESILISYKNFTKDGFKNFKVNIPKRIILNNRFVYFFGLWCGDRAGGKRFGICNKNKEILNFTEDFLKRFSQNTERILYIRKNVSDPIISYDKKFKINEEGKGWVLSIHSNNGIFSSFFYYLLSNIEFFLDSINNKEVFFAGLFDAEGNVSLYNKSFRWACKDKRLVSIYINHLNKLGFYSKYDGSCLISYNKDLFYRIIFPHLKNKDKINLTSLLCRGKGELPYNYKVILDYIKINPNKTQKEITKALKKNKVYSELGFLKDFNFISSFEYPNKFKINNKMIKNLRNLKL